MVELNAVFRAIMVSWKKCRNTEKIVMQVVYHFFYFKNNMKFMLERMVFMDDLTKVEKKKRKKMKSYQPAGLQNVFDAYVKNCAVRQRFVNVAGFCVFANISRTTFYNYRKNDKYELAMDYIDNVMEDETLNVPNKQYPIAILYLKNKFGYSDKVESRNVNTNIEHLISTIDDDEGLDL